MIKLSKFVEVVLSKNHSLVLLATVVMSKLTETVEDTEIVKIFVQFKKERKVKIQIFNLVHAMRFWNKLRQVPSVKIMRS